MALTATQVHQFYVGYYGRPADTAGLTYWQAQTEAAALTGFSTGAEFTSQYAGLTTTAQVTKVYANLLGRTPDAGGLAYWSGELTAGRETIGSLLLTVIKSALGKDVTTIADRVQYSTNFAAALDTLAEINAYNGAAANALARTAMGAIVATTVDDHASLTTADAAINATIVTIVTTGVTGSTFVLTSSSTPDIFTGTAGNDTITGAAGTFASTDVIVDSSTSDADILNLSMNSYTSTPATITNIETINATSVFASVGFDAASTTGVKTLNLVSSIAGSTATAAGVTLTKVANVVAGAFVGNLNVNTVAAMTTGTGGNVTIDPGTATAIAIGHTGSTGSDTFTTKMATGTTTTLSAGSGGTDTFTLNLTGGAETLTIANAVAGTADINVMNINSNTAANTVTLSSATHELAGSSTGDVINIGGTQALTIIGNGDVFSGTSATNGEAMTKAAGAGTVTLVSNTVLGAASFFNRAAVDVLSLTTAATGNNITINEATTLKMGFANASRTYDVGTNSTTGVLTAGSGTLKIDLAGSSAANAIQTSITTGLGVGTTIFTNNTIDSSVTTLDTSTTAATVDTVVVSGTKNMTVGTWTATAGEVMTASGLSGNLVATIGVNAATVIGGSGNDTITGGAAADSINGGSGNDVLNGGALADTVTGGLGNDRIVVASSVTIDTVTDFSISGTNGVDQIAFSIADILVLSAPKDGGAVAIAAGTTVKSVLVSAAKTLVADENVIVLSGTFANAAAMEVAIESGGTRQLTSTALTAGDDLIIVWSDGTNSHVGGYNDAVGATTLGATGTYTEIVTLAGITSVDAIASANFLFIA